MNEYIERHKLLEHLGSLDYNIRPTPQVISCILRQPTVDLVEVCRCKDCKYFYYETEVCILHSEVTSDNKEETFVHMKPTDFCSYAKRNKQNDEKE